MSSQKNLEKYNKQNLKHEEVEIVITANRFSIILNESVSVLKEYNICSHYVTKHADYRTKDLDRKHVRQQNFYRKVKIPQKAATRASFAMLDVVDQVCPDYSKKFDEVRLSMINAARRIEEIDDDTN
ncbi:hypothetical protein RF11_06396 [Thelohanellus kitauei]|uniref:Uncharacterized protein n=1 Tax=Thelohanellus kitauei TaxID=669202 RepID=A0A0C2N746_THEKT|nr:hypothetical protein RF11_06396 [Thelohanellus kitauei]